MLRNGEGAPLTPAQIAAHLHVKVWNVTRELQLADRQPHRLHGQKIRGEGVGRGGQWRVDRQAYLAWLQIPLPDRTHLGPDGLPELIPFAGAAAHLKIGEAELRRIVRAERLTHIAFGRMRYLTHNQLERLRVQLDESYREATPGGGDPGPVT